MWCHFYSPVAYLKITVAVSTLRENISDRVDNELKVTILNMLTHINPGPAQQQLVSVRSHIAAYVVPV